MRVGPPRSFEPESGRDNYKTHGGGVGERRAGKCRWEAAPDFETIPPEDWMCKKCQGFPCVAMSIIHNAGKKNKTTNS